ncbi:MAG: hypothetical protein CM1200mP10_19400 [Candidatus Neomarinimicrobiota bacterium]|nr:MAG: hypothetical protein CM1200mP10_19400 [Candidatus Neomarinimicrobiota bacterium]
MWEQYQYYFQGNPCRSNIGILYGLLLGLFAIMSFVNISPTWGL